MNLEFSFTKAKLMVVVVLLHSAHLSTCSDADTDENFEDFSFTQPLYHATVQEKSVAAVVESDVRMGMHLTNITKDVQFSVVEGDQRFQARKQVFGNFIFLNLQTSSITESKTIQIRAKSLQFSRVTFCTVQVQVKDVNDFQPLFPPQPYSVTIPEDTKVGSTITYVKASDSDSNPENTRLYYSLPQLTSDYFAVHPTTGAVILAAPLNAKSQSEHSVAIQAIDRRAALAGTAVPKTTFLTISVRTVNAYSPTIAFHDPSLFNISQVEHSNGQMLYAIIKVSDPDIGEQGKIRAPSIIHCDDPGLVAIQPRRKKNEYNLLLTRRPIINGIINATIEASDNGQPPRSTRKVIHINLLDKNTQIPIFLNLAVNVTISEISPVLTQVGFASAKLAKSTHHHGISYAIVSGNERGLYEINPNTSLITVKNSLKRIGMTDFQLRISATNTEAIDSNAKSYSVVTIQVQDANDHDPIFTENNYVVNVSETVSVGSELIKVEASDSDSGLNGSVIYSLVDSAELPFAINPFNGSIFTTGLLDADIMTEATYKLRVRAHDRGSPFSRRSECFVTVNVVNVNDNAPLFNEINCVISTPIHTPRGSNLIQLEPIDLDRDLVTCNPTSESKWFEIDSQTCVIRLAASLTKLRIGDQLFLDVAASDGKLTSATTRIQFKLVATAEITKDCHDTGAFRRFEDTMNNLRLKNSHGSETRLSFNRTSFLPNKYKPSVYPRNAVIDISVPEDTNQGSPVAQIRALDRDIGYNGKLWFTILSGNDESCFLINTQTGLMSLALPLDRERQSTYTLSISVSDLGIPPKSINVRVRFTISDVNDNPPMFDQDLYFFEIPENTSPGYKFRTKIKATDKDLGENARIEYKFLFPVQSNNFFIDPDTGYLNTIGHLDRETTSEYNLTVIATDSSPTKPLSSSVTLMIRVLDFNDNSPKFYQDLHRVRVAEDLPVHTVVFWLQAYDLDEGRNGRVRYSLTDGASNANDNTGPRFRVDDRTGAIRLSAPLDARVQNRYNVTARARDSGKRFSTCFIEIEVLPVNKNLHAPYFISRKVKLEMKENVDIGTQIGSMSAIDEDVTEPENDVRYYLTEGNGLGIFTIDENTGTITSQKALDRESEQYYWLTVVAEDRAPTPLSGRAFVLIEVLDVNDNAPVAELPLYIFNVSENSPFESFVGQIRTRDVDSGLGSKVSFRMPKNGRFKIEHDTGIIKTKRRLDREDSEAQQDLSFDVRITDAGTPRLSFVARVIINVTDTNDNVPIFSPLLKRKLVLPSRQSSETAQPLTRVVAWDLDAGKNGLVEYVLNSTQKFVINSTTGLISTSRGFREGQRSVLKIFALDHGLSRQSSKFRLEIEWVPPPPISNHPPVFSEPISEDMYFEHVDTCFVSEESPSDKVVQLLQADDLDSEVLWYHIVDGNEDDMFAISPDNALYVAGYPDAENRDFYNLTIRVTDGHNQAYKQIIVHIDDINDHPPVFINRTFAAVIGENMPVNSHVMRLTATDGDLTPKNRRFIFRIRSELNPSNGDMFHITPSGDVYTSVRLDRERQKEYLLIVEVDDQGVPGSLQDYCFVRIFVLDENEHSPEFSSPLYSGRVFLQEAESELGVDEMGSDSILQVQAIDRDHGENAKVTYSIETGNDDRLWSIDSVSGEIFPTRSLQMTYFRNGSQRIILTVKATDGGREPLFSTALVHIDIIKNNDVTPQFEVSNMTLHVSENSSAESFVTKVVARAPSSVTYDISSGNTEQKFFINPHSGVVSLVESLDRESQPIYNLTVSSVGFEGKKSLALVTIHVTDINDNRPVFALPSYTGYVTELPEIYAPIYVFNQQHQPLTVKAIDSDFGDNARIMYKIISAQKEVTSRFLINQYSGEIRYKPNQKNLELQNNLIYKFKVQAIDFGNPRLSSENFADVTVCVNQSENAAPEFSQSYYNFTLHLPTVEGVLVSRDIRVSPKKAQKSAALTYSIMDGNINSAFKINALNGDLSVADASIIRAGSQYNMRIRVSNGKRFSLVDAAVSILAFQQAGTFTLTQQIYEARILENSLKEQQLAVVSVTDAALEDHFRFRILNPTPKFQIGFTTGVVSSMGNEIDRESVSAFKLLVEVIDVSGSDESDAPRGRCLVRITVNDVNDNPPQFTDSIYHAVVPKNAESGAIVKKVRAIDLDLGNNALISYSLENESMSLFDVDPQTGVVTLRRHLDSYVENYTNLNITILAQDMGNPSLRSRAFLLVKFVDENTPIFTQIFYGEIFVLENAQPFTVVTDVAKASGLEDSKVFYSIENGDEDKDFDIDYRDGTIITIGKLDREQKDMYRLRVRARSSNSSVFSDAEVEIRVRDVNDNTPVFSEQHYTAKLVESAGERSFVTQIEATDADVDENGRVGYAILDNYSDGKHFFIDAESGVVWTVRKLDAETQKLFNFVVRSADFGQPQRHNDVMVTVMIDDVNDNPPVFEKDLFEFNIDAKASPGCFVGVILARDPDESDKNKLRYSIQHPTAENIVDVNPNAGVVTLKKSEIGSNPSTIRFNVSVSDGRFTAQSEISVQFISTDRSFSLITFDQTSYNFTITENQPEGTEVGRVSATGVGPLIYAIATDTSLSDFFRISSHNGIITTSQEIDRELVEKRKVNSEPEIHFQIIATDGEGASAMTDVYIKVLDENDNAPIFDRNRYVAVLVPSEAHIGHVVTNVTANDLDFGDNGRISYHWEDDQNNAKKFFNLNESTGQITIARNLKDLANSASIQLFVEARDHGFNPQTNFVSLSIYFLEDSSAIPNFGQNSREISIYENLPVGTEITVIQATAAKGTIRYALAEPYVNDDIMQEEIRQFAIDSHAGLITTTSPMDREIRSSYNLIILAYVEAYPELVASFQVIINLVDENDNNPEFDVDAYQVSVLENSAIPTNLIKVRAVDPDQDHFGAVTYSLDGRDSDVVRKFAIDSESGTLRLITKLDREQKPRFDVLIIATDGGKEKGANKRRTSICHVIVDVIDINDNAPLFSKKNYEVTISEGAATNHITPQFIHVTDADDVQESSLSVSIIDGNENGRFRLKWNQKSANRNILEASLQVARPLDRETKTIYDLMLIATDGLHNASARIRVVVGDINDNPPFCQQMSYYGRVSENNPLRSFILRVYAEDLDSGENGRIVYSLSGLHSDRFDLDPHSGQLYTSAVMDREDREEYSFIATSRDRTGQSCASQIYITIDDVNDNPPQFDPSSLHAAPKENLPVNSVFHRVVVHDPDRGENGSFMVSLSDDGNGQFYIEPETGLVVLTKPLDREKVSSYDVGIQVTDRGRHQQLTTSAVLLIQVLDVNDNPPVFDKIQYEVKVNENASLGHMIGAVSARSLDIGANARLSYSIVRGNEHNKFAVDSETGQVTIASELDYETDRSYVLKLAASDMSDHPLTSECTMKVEVMDVNDNPPEFASTAYHVSLAEDTPVDSVFLTLFALDQDSNDAGNVTYQLEATDSLFKINEDSGKLEIAHPGLDYETQNSHVFKVIARDSGIPRLSAHTTVNVTVVDVNDNRPTFKLKAPPGGVIDPAACLSNGVNCTFYVRESETVPVEKGIVRLSADDADGDGNGSPFSFRIKDGNDADLFYLDENNVLKSVKPLTLNDLPENLRSDSGKQKHLIHNLRLEVEDFGSPLRLSSDPDLHLNIVVIKESLYPPVMTSHEILIVLSPDAEEFVGDGITRKLHATDRDFYDRDRLRFSLSSPNDFERFVIDPLTGAISATVPLPIGVHNITVRVSDGSRITLSTVSITVIQINQQSIESSVAVSFSGINVKSYFSSFHSHFIEKLETLLPEGFVAKRDLLLMSIQASGNSTELLFGIRKPPISSSKSGREYYLSKSIQNILDKNRLLIQESVGVKIEIIEGTNCAVRYCAHGKCSQVPTFLNYNGGSTPISTDSYSVVAPLFERIKTCQCPLGTTGDSCESICSSKNNPCPRGHRCIQDQSENLGYRCDPPNRSSTIMSFTGRSFIQFSLDQKTRNLPFQVNLRLKTFQSNATVFYASGSGHFAKLETYMGYLRFSFNCGSEPQTMLQDLLKLIDGRWSNVVITAMNESPTSPCGFRLTLNGKYIATVKSPGGKSNLNITELIFGGQPGLKSKRSLSKAYHKSTSSSNNFPIKFGFRGCIQNVEVNGLHLTGNPKSEVKIKDKTGISNKCSSSLINMGACNDRPCLNNGRCLPMPDGAHECDCPPTYNGDNCEELNLCASIPCQNKGYCTSDGSDVQCHCDNGFSGKRCETSLACQAIEKCHHGGNCTVDNNGQPRCLCDQGWTGQHCEIDINECESTTAQDTCGGHEKCFNYEGGFACNCQDPGSEIKHPKCKFVADLLEQPSSPNDDQSSSIIIIAGSCLGGVLIISIIITVVCIRRKKKQKNGRRYRGGSRRSEDITPIGNFNSSRHRPSQLLPPQIPRRPSDYQPSSSDPFSMTELEQRNPLVGLVHPQIPMATFSSSAAPSDNGSVRKTSSLQQEYNHQRVPESSLSSVLHLPPSRRSSSSFVDQQGNLWDIVGRRPSGSAILTPSLTSVPHQIGAGAWGKRSDAPSSPESHRSFMSSASARRGHRSQRSDALPGHYNTGKRRRQKQLLQMIALKEKNEQENVQIQRVLSHLVNQELQDDYYYEPDSRNSSLRSSLSQYRSSMRRQDPATGATSSLVSSYSKNGGRSADARKISDPHSRHFSEGASHSLGSSSDKTPDTASSPTSGMELPPPPNEYELQALKEEDENIGSSSQLSRDSAFTAAPMSSSHFSNPQLSSNQLHSASCPENSRPKKSRIPPAHSHHHAPYFDVRKDHSTAPPTPAHFKEHLPMSSLSEDEENAQLQYLMRSERTNVQSKHPNKRMKKKLKKHRKPNTEDTTTEQEVAFLPVFDDVNS